MNLQTLHLLMFCPYELHWNQRVNHNVSDLLPLITAVSSLRRIWWFVCLCEEDTQGEAL